MSIQLKRSSTAGNTPSLSFGELAINEADGFLFYRDPSAAVAKLKLAEAERLIVSGTVTNAANVTLSVDPAVIGIFRAFRLFFTDWRPVTSGSLLFLRLGGSTGIKSGGSDYAWGTNYASQANTSFFSSDADAADSGVKLTIQEDTTASLGSIGMVWLGTNDPAATVQNLVLYVTGAVYAFSGNYPFTTHGGGGLNTALLLTQIQLSHDSGNISTGRYTLFGIP